MANLPAVKAKLHRLPLVGEERIKNPAASPGVSERRDEIFPKSVTPECFYRGSSSGLACDEHGRTTAKDMRE